MDESNPNEPPASDQAPVAAEPDDAVRSEPPAADSASAPSQSDRPAPSSHSDAGDSVDDPAAVSAELPREQAAHVRPSKPTTKPSGIREFFLLSSAEDAESALGGDSAAFRKLFDRAERRAEAAISLWNAGIYPEAYSLLSSACDALREMDERFASLRALTGPMGTLRMTLPSESLEDKVTAEAQREFDERREQLTVAIGALRGVALGKSRRAWIRTQRLLVSMLFALAIGGGVGKFLNRITLTANASASYNLTQYPPKNAIDGDYSTNWLLTDGTAGWIEVAFRKRNVNAIRLYNVRGLVRYGAADTNIEFYLNGRVVRSMPVNLRPTVNSLEPFRVPLVGSIQADKIRFNIQAFHDLGGGLAEIEVE